MIKSIVHRHNRRVAKLMTFGHSFVEAEVRAIREQDFRNWLDYTKHGDAFFPAGLTFNKYLDMRELTARQIESWRSPRI